MEYFTIYMFLCQVDKVGMNAVECSVFGFYGDQY